MSEQLPRGRSLESLKKEAKRWLAQLRSNDAEARARFERALPDAPASPALRDVQHALAREHGLRGWAALTAALETARGDRLSLGEFEAAAIALHEAYVSGTPEAMERHYRHTWHRRAWDAMRSYVQLDLGKRPSVPGEDVEITPDDARYLVATENGFESWDALVAYVEGAASKAGLAIRPVQAFAMAGDARASELRTREWSAVREFLSAHDATGLNAHGQMTDAAMRALSRVDGVASLDLGGSKRLTDEGIRHLSRMTSLKNLDLSGTDVTDRGLAVLEQLPNLETLSLGMTRVTDAGMAHLRACERLREVAMMWTQTGDGLLRALAGKESVRRVISGSLVTDSGLASLGDIPAFRHWLGGEEVMSLTSYESAPNNLTLRGSFTDAGMRHLRDLEGLYGLNIDASELALTAACLESLVSLPHLAWLACDARDDWMPAIARMPHLRFLGAQDTLAGDDGFAALSDSRSIEYIWGRRCHNLQRRGFQALARMPKLRALSVSCLNVDDVGLAALPSFPALRELMPMDIPDAGYAHIAKCTELDRLVLMYCRDTTDAATEHVVRLPKLTYYFNSYTEITDRTPALLSTMESLESVTFSGCHGLTDAGVEQLARLPRLRELDVSGRGLTPAVSRAFPPRVTIKYFE